MYRLVHDLIHDFFVKGSWCSQLVAYEVQPTPFPGDPTKCSLRRIIPHLLPTVAFYVGDTNNFRYTKCNLRSVITYVE